MNEIDLRRFDLNLLAVFEVLMRERSVTRAAERLGRTQSAVSHSLSRLRDQLGDPLLIKGGRRMEPTAFALEFIEQVRPLLRGIERVLSPRQQFEPATLAPRLPAGGARFCARPVHRPAGAICAPRHPAFRSNGPARARRCCWRSRRARSTSPFRPPGSACPRALSARTSGRWNGDASPVAAIRRSRNGAPGRGRAGRTWSSGSAISSRARSMLPPPRPASSGRSPDGCPTSRSSRRSWPRQIFWPPCRRPPWPARSAPSASNSRRVPFAIDPIPHVMLWSAARAKDPEIAWLRNRLRPLAKSRFTSLAG